MKNKLYILHLILLGLVSKASIVIAQSSEQPAMADAMRANGKIYVVVGVLVIILTGLIIYLFRLDSKLTRIEKRIK